ncbi:MAG: hypothetical protein DRH17_10980 [Deltaproteobacteria bacterium]|nr:MAG: hypothetical protein DRH17_10980 [Deltaproteobacteria bacterium]
MTNFYDGFPLNKDRSKPEGMVGVLPLKILGCIGGLFEFLPLKICPGDSIFVQIGLKQYIGTCR